MPLLTADPGLLGTTVLNHLQDLHPGRFHGVLRTLQRRIRQWRALAGPSRVGSRLTLGLHRRFHERNCGLRGDRVATRSEPHARVQP